MIIGNLNNINRYQAQIPSIAEIRQYIDSEIFTPLGKWQEISDSLRVIRLNDWNRNHILFESHKNFYDLHFTLKGADKLKVCIGFTNTTLNTEYNVENDYSLYIGREDVEVVLREGNWAFILTTEPHRNEFVCENTEKLVFKIRI